MKKKDKILLHKKLAAVKSRMKLKLELLHLVLLMVVKLKLVRLKHIVLVLIPQMQIGGVQPLIQTVWGMLKLLIRRKSQLSFVH